MTVFNLRPIRFAFKKYEKKNQNDNLINCSNKNFPHCVHKWIFIKISQKIIIITKYRNLIMKNFVASIIFFVYVHKFRYKGKIFLKIMQHNIFFYISSKDETMKNIYVGGARGGWFLNYCNKSQCGMMTTTWMFEKLSTASYFYFF